MARYRSYCSEFIWRLIMENLVEEITGYILEDYNGNILVMDVNNYLMQEIDLETLIDYDGNKLIES